MTARVQIDPATARLLRLGRNAPKGALACRVDLSPVPAGALCPDRPDAGAVDAALAAMAPDEPEADDKLRAAYLVGRISQSLCGPLATLALEGLNLPLPEPGGVGLMPRPARWEKQGQTGITTVFDLVIDLDRLTGDPTGIGAVLEHLCTPVITELSRRSGLSLGALWRVAGDVLSAALLDRGKATGQLEAAMDMARAILDDPYSPLKSRQTGFIHVAPEGRPELGEWFRERGGCCRYYTLPHGEYCNTCVLRDRASRIERLQAYLLGRAAAGE